MKLTEIFLKVKRLLKIGWGSLKGAWFSILHYKELQAAVPGSPEAPRNTVSLREDLKVKSPNDQVLPNNTADVSSTPRCFLAWLFRDSNILDSDPDAHAALGVAQVLTSRLWSAVLRATKHQHPWEELSGTRGHVQFTPCHQSPPTPQLLWEEVPLPPVPVHFNLPSPQPDTLALLADQQFHFLRVPGFKQAVLAVLRSACRFQKLPVLLLQNPLPRFLTSSSLPPRSPRSRRGIQLTETASRSPFWFS